MRGRADVLCALAMAEFRGALRGRFVQGFGLLFAALAVGIALAGLSASGQLLVQGFVRTSASLLTLSVATSERSNVVPSDLAVISFRMPRSRM